jgi:hypothetical protein
MFAKDLEPADMVWEELGINRRIADEFLASDSNKRDASLPFYSSIIPPSISTDNSFIVSSRCGAGKSALWHHLKEGLLQESDILVVEPVYNPDWLETALEVFIQNTAGVGHSKKDDTTWITNHWRGKDMIDFVISRITHVMLENFDKLDISHLSIHERFVLLVTTCLYYSGNSMHAIKPLVKKLIEKQSSSNSLDWYMNTSSIPEDISDYNDLLQLSSDIAIIEKVHTDRLKVLHRVMDDFGVKATNVISRNRGTLYREGILFDYIRIIEKAGLKVVLALDEIDKVPILGTTEQEVSTDAFTCVIKSIEPLLYMAHAQKLLLFLFVMEYTEGDIEQIFPNFISTRVAHYKLNWNKAALNGYANFVFDFLQKTQGKRGSFSLPQSFSELVGGDKCVNLFLSKASQPRQFNELFSEFIFSALEGMSEVQDPFGGPAQESSKRRVLKFNCMMKWEPTDIMLE